MGEQLKKRYEIEENLKWDLSRIFQTEEEYEKAVEEVILSADELSASYRGKLQNKDDVISLLESYNALLIKINHVSEYAYLDLSVDMTNEFAQKREANLERILSQVNTKIKFVENELMELPEKEIRLAMEDTEKFKTYLEILLEQKVHRLSAESEELLATLRPAINLAYKGYEVTKLSDIRFPDFEVEGKSYPLSYVLFENNYQIHPNIKIRRAAFKAFSAKLSEYVNTTANYYSSHTQTEKTLSKLRGFDSVFDYLLFSQRVSVELQDRQIDLIMKHLAPHMRRYVKLLQKIHGIETMTFADLKIALDPEYGPTVSIEESKEYIKGALKVLGDEYLEIVMKSYEERWTDYAQNIGKSTGGFCSSPYKKNSYILLSWNGNLSEVFTLVHELGHAGHFAFAQRYNAILQEECSTYFVEAPSTTNEMLLSNYLIQKNSDPRFQRWVLSSMIGNTYYHNFVTHLLEAAFQREVYRAIDKGESLQAGDYCRIKREILKEFWGDTVEINEGAELTWMRQPHYYMGLYPYTYSAGLTVGTQISQRILKEGKAAADDWIEVLKAGGSKNPIELAKMAGVDITTDKPLMDTIAYIGDVITEIENLSNEI